MKCRQVQIHAWRNRSSWHPIVSRIVALYSTFLFLATIADHDYCGSQISKLGCDYFPCSGYRSSVLVSEGLAAPQQSAPVEIVSQPNYAVAHERLATLGHLAPNDGREVALAKIVATARPDVRVCPLPQSQEKPVTNLQKKLPPPLTSIKSIP